MKESIDVESLNNLLSIDSLKNVNNDSINSHSASAALKNFINDNLTLQGSQWDAVRTKLSKYDCCI